ncbi:hypothetical protein ID866_3628 [Astraeus odoratus]|nr:hypothetical protein ID866_3628 [Astraeus odoratus]
MVDRHLRQRKKDTADLTEGVNSDGSKPTRASREATSHPRVEHIASGVASSSMKTYAFIFLLLSLLFWGGLLVQLHSLWDRAPSRRQERLPGVRHDAVPIFTADETRREAVVEAFRHAWSAYERDAMGDDEYHPISAKGTNLTAAGGIGYTIVDSIDAMLIMGLHDEYERAKTWVQEKLSFDRDDLSYQTTIRILGGLLSVYHLSGEDPMFLEKARELGDRMLPVFDTPSGLPLTMVNLHLQEGVPDPGNGGYISTAEAATLQLEFRYLSYLTEDDVYWDKVEQVMAVLNAAEVPHGLVPIFINPTSGSYGVSPIRLGSRGDSYYEYLLKQYLQTNQTEDVYRQMYAESMTGIHTYLVQRTAHGNLLHTAELIPERGQDGKTGWRLSPKQDHLVCFLGGSLMLGATTTGAVVDHVSVPPLPREFSHEGKRDWSTGVELIKTCLETHNTQTGLSPEIAFFRFEGDNADKQAGFKLPKDWYIKGSSPGKPPPLDARYILRPETVESLFIAFRLTGDPWYRDQGWEIFQAIEKHCRIPTGGYAGVKNVDGVPVEHEDKMETFMMSETLKYLYLLFSDANVLPLNEYVFNTEAHPLPIFTPSMPTGFS